MSAPVLRPTGLSVFVRCKNEQEYIVASLASVHRFADEVVLALNRSTDDTRRLVDRMLPRYDKIRIFEYEDECAPIGPGYLEAVMKDESRSLARYYNWCLEKTSFSHVCKWDGDMIALPNFGVVRDLITRHDAVTFDGHDVIGEKTTDYEARIFRYNMQRAIYKDWDLYEVLDHSYTDNVRVEEKCYLHMKLVKSDWLLREWVNPNDSAKRSVPETGRAPPGLVSRLRGCGRRVRDIVRRAVGSS